MAASMTGINIETSMAKRPSQISSRAQAISLASSGVISLPSALLPHILEPPDSTVDNTTDPREEFILRL
jgi:hypothetical protein